MCDACCKRRPVCHLLCITQKLSLFHANSIVCLLQETAAIHEGLFLAATLGGMLIARVTPDGRFNVLHNLARPPDAREGCLPYPTWRLRTPARSSSPIK